MRQMITKAVIPAAGLGTRFLPATKTMPKEMLCIVDTPAIHFVVKEAVDSGIEDIIIITGRGKRAIEDYFDHAPELENYLANAHKYDLLTAITEMSSQVDIHYIRQKEPRGLGDAILKAEKHVGPHPFAVLLGDDLVRSEVPCIKQLIHSFNASPKTLVAVQRIPREKVGNYGIVDVEALRDSTYRIKDIIEKPSLDEAPSNIAAIGRYVFEPQIFDHIKATSPGKGGEIQIADAIKGLMQTQNVYAYEVSGRRYDVGDKFGYLQAIVDFALERDDLRPQMKKYLAEKNAQLIK
jgi:UTP--glucose-1-phosphate uridylyltransferase